MREIAALDTVGRHAVTDDPGAADMIVFVESARWDSACGPYLSGVRRDPVYRQYRSKSLVYSGYDFPIAFVPGIYPSIERTWSSRSWARSGPYLVGRNPYISDFAGKEAVEPRLLASFSGSMSNQPVRRRLRELGDPSVAVADNTDEFVGAALEGRTDQLDDLKREFVETVSRSRFVLCPRGWGASSTRLFEVMEMGRAPVIISDQWLPPDGPDWQRFSIQVHEADVHLIPDLLRAREAESEALGLAARQAWEQWFAPDRMFDQICSTGESLLGDLGNRAAGTARAYANLARPFHARRLARRAKQSLRR